MRRFVDKHARLNVFFANYLALSDPRIEPLNHAQRISWRPLERKYVRVLIRKLFPFPCFEFGYIQRLNCFILPTNYEPARTYSVVSKYCFFHIFRSLASYLCMAFQIKLWRSFHIVLISLPVGTINHARKCNHLDRLRYSWHNQHIYHL